MPQSTSLRLKKKDKGKVKDLSDSPSSLGSKVGRSTSFNLHKFLKRKSSSPSRTPPSPVPKSRSMQIHSRPLSTKSMNKSKSVPAGLAKSAELHIPNGSNVDLSKIPLLPPMESIRRSKSRNQELELIKRKLIGRHSERHPQADEEDEGAEDDEEEQGGDENLDHREIYNGSRFHIPKVKISTSNSLDTQAKVGSLISSTPNETTETTCDESIQSTPMEAKPSSNGLLSTIMNSLNFRSLTDLAEGHHQNDSHTSTENISRSSTLSSNENQTDENQNGNENQDRADYQTNAKPPLSSSVTFVPVKKSLLSTLGQGSLTLDAFPPPIEESLEDPIKTNFLDSSGADNTYLGSSPYVSSNFSNQANQSVNPGLQVTQLTSENKNLLRRSISPGPRLNRSSINVRNSLSSVLSDDDNAVANSTGIKKKLRLSVRDKNNRQSLDSVGNIISRYNTNYDDPGELSDSTNHRKEVVAERLGVKLPSDKRQESFHILFPGLPSNEIFIEDYACAYRKDILIQGRLYLSERYISFHSNIIGLVTHFSIPLSKILTIQKKKTVGIPNALEFSTLHDKYIFASFISRDATYDLISKLWSGASNGDSLNMVDLALDDDEVESVDPISDSDDSDDEENDRDQSRGPKLKHENTVSSTEANSTAAIAKNNRQLDDSDASISDSENMVKEGEDETVTEQDNAFNGITFEGPRSHTPTSNDYVTDSADIKIIDDSISAPLGVVYSLLFGDDVAFVKNLVKAQKNIDISEIPKFVDKKRSYSYVKPLNSSVGPKQTRCNVQETVDVCDFNKCCQITQMTESPDVPSGSAFKVKTKIYLSWGPNNSTKIYIVTCVVWTGKSWIKGPIERGTISGQKESLGVLVQELRKKINAGANGANISSNKRKKGRKHRDYEEKQVINEPLVEIPTEEQPVIPKSAWENVTNQMDLKLILIFILFVVMLWDKFWSWKSLSSNNIEPVYGIYSPERMLESESELWDWIDTRKETSQQRKSGLLFGEGENNRSNWSKKDQGTNEKLSDQEIKDVIDVLEKRLQHLKGKTVQQLL